MMELLFIYAPFIIILFFVGALAGLLAGLLGIGGGIIIVPTLYYILSFVPEYHHIAIIKMAVVTSMTTILPTGLSATLSHYKNNNINWYLYKTLLLPIIVGVFIGNYCILYINPNIVKLLFACIMIIASIHMLKPYTTPHTARVMLPHKMLYNSLSMMIGILSALVGIGGATLSVPMMHYYGEKIKKSIGTASAIGVVIASVSILYQLAVPLYLAEHNIRAPFSIGYINWLAFGIIISMSVITAKIGSSYTQIVDHRKLKKIFAIFLLVIAISMVYGAFKTY